MNIPRILSIRRYLVAWAAMAGLAAMMSVASAADMFNPKDPLDWPHWRGPSTNGMTLEKNLPESWSPKGENLIWRKPELATRCTPVILNGKGYTVCRAFPESTREGEKTVCFDIETGEIKWESIHNVFLTDAPAERVGWSSPIADPQTGNIYVLGLGCQFQCLDGETGKVIWEHAMSEEYGMISTYGGRTNFPTIFENLVIIGGVMTGWGDTAIPAHRIVAFDKYTGASVWFISTRLRPEDTCYGTPIFTSFNGQTAMVVSAGDGGIYAFQPRTGKQIWKYQATNNRGTNVSPLIVDGIVYCAHAEQNADKPNVQGALFAFDGRTEGEIPESKLLWKIPLEQVSRSCPILVDGRVYYVDDGGKMIIVDAKTGKEIATKKLGRIMFGSLVYGDGKIYAGENNSQFYILKPTENGVEELSRVRLNTDDKIYASPIISHGKIYLATEDAMYCIGKKDATPSADPRPPETKEASISEDMTVTQIQLAPAELMVSPGQNVQYQVRGYNKNGQYIKLIENAEFTFKGEGKMAPASNQMYQFTAPTLTRPDAVIITAKSGDMTSTVRVRVIPNLPWTHDFNDKTVPLTWIGATYRHQPRQIDGEDALVKISTIPKGTRSQAWMGWPELHDYTIQADFYGTDKDGKMPDMGLINQRYTLDMQAVMKLQIRSWTSRLENRFAKTVQFDWSPKTWYTMKFQSETVNENKVILRGKVWKRGEAEPAEWMIEAADETPNLMGSPGLFGNSAEAEFYIDNVKVVANSPK